MSNQAIKLSGLTRDQNHPHDTRKVSIGYTRFIRTMKFILPALALCIIAILFSWNILKPDQIEAIEATPAQEQIIGKNELLTPQFESTDDKNQPFTITANRALQDIDDKTVILENPIADMTMNSGNWLAIKAEQGTYNQETKRVTLKNNVTFFHDDGYSAETSALDIDMQNGITTSKTAITAFGPLGTLNATAMTADTTKDIFIFNGPAKLVLQSAQGTQKDTP